MVHGICRLLIIDDAEEIASEQSPAGKPFLRLIFKEGQAERVVDVTLNLGEMIGGAARGAQQRFGFVPR